MQLFVDLPFHRMKLEEDFGRERWDQYLKIFRKPSAINGFGMPLPTSV